MNLAQIYAYHDVVFAALSAALMTFAGVAGLLAKRQIAGKQTAAELLAKVDEVTP